MASCKELSTFLVYFTLLSSIVASLALSKSKITMRFRMNLMLQNSFICSLEPIPKKIERLNIRKTNMAKESNEISTFLNFAFILSLLLIITISIFGGMFSFTVTFAMNLTLSRIWMSLLVLIWEFAVNWHCGWSEEWRYLFWYCRRQQFDQHRLRYHQS